MFFGIPRAVVNFGTVMIRNRSIRSAEENEKQMPRRHEMRHCVLVMKVRKRHTRSGDRC
jgi:hypothetical protein